MATILLFIVIIGVFWFFMIRPQQRRQREAQQMRSALEPGAKVMLTSGIFGSVREITDDHVLVEIADDVAIRVVRAAIGQVLPAELDEPTSEVEAAEPEENE